MSQSCSSSTSPASSTTQRTTQPAFLARTGLLLQMHVHWELRAHQGYLQAAGFRWPRPARMA